MDSFNKLSEMYKVRKLLCEAIFFTATMPMYFLLAYYTKQNIILSYAIVFLCGAWFSNALIAFKKYNRLRNEVNVNELLNYSGNP